MSSLARSTQSDDSLRDDSLAQRFHRVRSVLDSHQALLTVVPTTSVTKALALMAQHGYSQLPIVAADGSVLGVFSYRSLARAVGERMPDALRLDSLDVLDTMEQPAFVQEWARWETTLSALEDSDYVLVGGPDGISGILTGVDMLRYLNREAAPFVLLAGIELTVRDIIKTVLDDEELQACVATANAKLPESRRLPVALDDMSLAHYQMLICHGDNWPSFEQVFGHDDVRRKSLGERLNRIAQRRNEAFHFRRTLSVEDVARLEADRDWLESRLRDLRAKSTKREAKPAQSRASGEWTEEAFFAHMATRCNDDLLGVARRLMDWCRRKELAIYWGSGTTRGSFIPAAGYGERQVYPFALLSTGHIELYFYWMGKHKPFNDEHMMVELVSRFASIEGVELPPDAARRRPKVPLSLLVDERRYEQFLGVYEWVIAQIEMS